MPIYTKTGDKGQTSLFGGTRVPKHHLRVETYGTIDELNSILGMVVAEITNAHVIVSGMISTIKTIQNDLLDIGSRLANPSATPDKALVTLLVEHTNQFEKYIDDMTEQLPPLQNFILPGGGRVGSLLHTARAVSRRAERRIVELMHQEHSDEAIVQYINRLSDLLFTMSRFVNHMQGENETIWKKK
jgi:cob(I)alamin adenosyltransferase